MSKRKSVPNIMDQLQGLGPPKSAPQEVPSVEAKGAPPPQERRKNSPARPANSSKRTPAKRITPRERLDGRATYDIGKELKEVILSESIQLGIPASQLAKYLLIQAWNMYIDEEIPQPALTPSNSPKFRNMIDFRT